MRVPIEHHPHLTEYGVSFAANREDVWILDQFPKDYRGHAVDVGAYDGLTRSNTLLLETFLWTVLCIEPNPNEVKKLKQSRPFVMGVACDREPKESAEFKIHLDNPEAHSGLRPEYHPVWHPEPNARWSSVPVQVMTLDQCLAKAEFPKLDAVSIDVEGQELDVLKGFDIEKWKPKVMVVESWDENSQVVEYLKEKGYDRVERRLVNDLMVRRG